MPEFSSLILSLKPSTTGAEDGYVWHPISNGIYTAKSGYYSLRSIAQQITGTGSIPGGFDWIKDVWAGDYSPKIKTFLWSAIQKAIPIGENLQRRDVTQEAKCIRCGDLEIEAHIFFKCDFARKVWQQFDLSPTVDIASQTGLKTALVASRITRCLPPLGVTTNILPWIFWAMWTARNTLIFEKKTFTVEDTAIKGIRLAREWIQAQPASHASPVRAMRGSTSRLVLEATHRSSTDITNCKTDAAWDKKTNTAGIAWIIEDPPPIHRLAGSDDTSNHLLSSCG